MKIIFVHGNGGGNANDQWLPATAKAFERLGCQVINKTFPDNEIAHENIWIPHLEKLGADKDTIIIGHSSGAVAAMRYAEKHQIAGSVLIGACYTDLGDETERESGYYDKPWGWNDIKKNQAWIIQFASTDDPYIPIEEARHIHEKLNSEYHEFNDRGHFMYEGVFKELVEAIQAKLN